MAAQDIDIGRVGGAADDPFALGGAKGNKIHIRVQQRNGRKSITTIQVRLGEKRTERRTHSSIYKLTAAATRLRRPAGGGPPFFSHLIPPF
jgi:translation initiation factor 1 (eIF-1/SUI1)